MKALHLIVALIMFSYENLDVYKKAFEANKKVYNFIKENAPIPLYAKNQLGRASLSIMLNIAEGCAKFSNRDRANFYTTARGSAFECASIITFLFEENEITLELKTYLYNLYDEISKMLFTMIKNLK